MYSNKVLDVHKILENLSHEDADVRRQAVLSLGPLKDKNYLPVLISLLEDPVKAVQEAVVDTLIELRGREVVTALSLRLVGAHLTVRNLIMEVLKEVGQDAPDVIIAGLLGSQDPFIQRTYCEILGAVRRPESIPYLTGCLQSPDVLVSLSAAEALGHIGDPQAVPSLLESLKGPTWVKCAVLGALEKIGDSQVLEQLLQIPLQAEDPAVAFLALKALGRLGDERCLPYLCSVLKGHPGMVIPVIQALEKLSERLGEGVYERIREVEIPWAEVVPLLSSRDGAVRNSAIRIAGKLRLKEAVAPLIQLMEFAEDEELMDRVIEALVEIGGQELDAIHQALFTEEIRVKVSLLRVLGRIGEEDSVPLLIQALEHPHEEVRIEAARALGQVRTPVALEPLMRRLQDSFGHVRRSAAASLGALGDPKALIPLVETLKDPYIDVRNTASQAIVQIHGATDEEKIRAVRPLLAERREEVRVVALQTLSRIARERLLGLYVECLKDESWKVREAAVLALNSSVTQEVEALLLPLLKDENSQVRIAVVKMLSNFPGDKVIQALLSGLEDPDPRVRYEVCKQLKSFNHPQVIQGLIKSLRDSSGMVQLAAIESLCHVRAVEAVEPLRHISEGKDPELAEEINRALKLLTSIP